MGSLQSELAKVSQHAGPSNSCDARPSSDKKARPRETTLVKSVHLPKLHEAVGAVTAQNLMGLPSSTYHTYVTRGTVPLVVDKCAEALLKLSDREPEERMCLLVMQVPYNKLDAVTSVMDAMQVQYKEFNDG